MAKESKKNPSNILNEPAVSYIRTKKTLYPATADDTSLSAAYIKNSISILGTNNIKPFSNVQSNTDFIQCIREGVQRKALDELMSYAGISIEEITQILHISDRTLRRYTPQQKLNESQTERLIEIAKLYSRGEEVFGNLELFKEWMNGTVMALGNKKPKTFLDTSLGISILMDELGRIEYGIFA